MSVLVVLYVSIFECVRFMFLAFYDDFTNHYHQGTTKLVLGVKYLNDQ